MNLIDKAEQRPDGNAMGLNQYTSGTVDIVHGSTEDDRPTGNASQTAVRRRITARCFVVRRSFSPAGYSG
jgi:hypothetical protein